jgi:hypothetical protein
VAEHNTASLFGEAASLTERLENVHDAILARLPDVDRVACALYDAQTDLLKTFINSTRSGEAIALYEYELSKSRSLSALARDRTSRPGRSTTPSPSFGAWPMPASSTPSAWRSSRSDGSRSPASRASSSTTATARRAPEGSMSYPVGVSLRPAR